MQLGYDPETTQQFLHALLRDVGLDVGLTIHSIGQPWSWSNSKILVGNAGVDVVF